MATPSPSIPLFAGTEDVETIFLATMEEMDKEIADEVVIAHPLWEYLQKRKLIEYRDEIAIHVPVKLRTKKNPTVQWMTAYEDANSTPAELGQQANFAYGHITGRQMYNREELVKNQGGQIIDLVESKGDELFADLNEEFADTIIGTQDADGRKPLGLGRVMDPTLAIGGVAVTTLNDKGVQFWKPQDMKKVGGASYALATEFREGMRRAYRLTSITGGGKMLGKGDAKSGQGVKPDVLICGEDVYNEHQKWAENILRISLSDIKDSSGWGDFEMFDWNGTTIIYEPALAAKSFWLMNFKTAVKVRIHSGTNFTWTPWNFLPNKVQVKYRDLLTYVSVYCRSRRANCTGTFT